MKRSIRRKVLQLLLSFTCMLSVMFAAIAFVVSFATEDKVIENVLNEESDYLLQQYQDGLNLTPRLTNVVVFPPDRAMPYEYQELLAAVSPIEREVTDKKQQHWHIKTLVLPDGRYAYIFLNATTWLALPSLKNEITILLLALMASSILIAFAFAYALTRKITSPLVHLSELLSTQPQKIATSKMLKRDDEIGLLARTFHRTLSSLQSALDRESDFTRDVGHELRTPIAVIKNFLTFQRHRTLQPEELAELERQIEYVGNCVQSLMALARAEGVEKESFLLRAVLEETLMSTLSPEQLEAFEFQIEVPYELKITAHKELSIVLIRNLLNNAVNYARSPKLKIEATKEYWRFSNHAKSLPDAPLSRHSKGYASKGIGQGLYLVDRIAKAQNWDCDCILADDTFTVTLYWAN